ncbi:hypothetical protein NHX12_019849 [Muraenolepis orangiensis]|uniref:TATA box-binding protein-like protein 2 n=1 Tax=Muraenolepis orangiensis TaxID=630683 RepID=A0A9Q0IXK8_9TELE|nr:hypothetical protein NHX12_019849 [Muraenolepis orangiensis]
MDECALERYFDDSIANDVSFMFDEDPEGPSQDDSFGGEEPKKKEEGDLDLSFLPDELSSQAAGHVTGDANEAVGNNEEAHNVSQDSGICPDYSTQNATAAQQNIVSTVNLGCPLDLKFIALQARNAEYNPKRFAAVIMRIRDPRTTALIFSSGKMVCTGAKSEEQSRLAARKYARVVQKLGFPARFLDFKIQNMVASCDVCFPIRLEGLVLTHQQFSSYEPELFPGLIYRMVKPRIVLLIFVSGKVVLTGAKERQEIYDAFENIYPILKGFRKQ